MISSTRARPTRMRGQSPTTSRRTPLAGGASIAACCSSRCSCCSPPLRSNCFTTSCKTEYRKRPVKLPPRGVRVLAMVYVHALWGGIARAAKSSRECIRLRPFLDPLSHRARRHAPAHRCAGRDGGALCARYERVKRQRNTAHPHAEVRRKADPNSTGLSRHSTSPRPVVNHIQSGPQSCLPSTGWACGKRRGR